MTVLPVLLLAVVLNQDAEVDTLIRSLGSDSPAERERVERRLIDLGTKVRTAVLRASTDVNPEISARAREILRHPDFRMEELYEAGFKRETAASLPNLKRLLWSSSS